MPCCDDPDCECNNPICPTCAEPLFGWDNGPECARCAEPDEGEVREPCPACGISYCRLGDDGYCVT